MTLDEMKKSTRQILKDLGMDKVRTNVRSVRILLALAHLDENTPWSDATDGRYTTHEISQWISERLDYTYAENSRESLRKDTLKFFVQGGIALFNDDDPARATNSSHNCYRLSPDALTAIRAYTTVEYTGAVAKFRAGHETLVEQQAMAREMERIPIRLPDGNEATLSGGGQNALIKQMVEDFCSRFVPGGIVLFIDDTDKETGSVADDIMRRLSIEIPIHGKKPDLIVWDDKRDWLFMMEACSTHGPINEQRKRDLKALVKSDAPIVYVTCFPDRTTMRRYLSDLAWETEAWCADTPDHMIHMDGQRFLGPYEE